MKKRGVSEVISIFFAILVVTIIIIIIFSYIKNYKVEQAQSKLNCIKDVNVEILDACYENNVLKITLKNRNDIILGDFFLVTIYYQGTSKVIPTPYLTYLNPYEAKTILMPYYEGTEKIKVIPRIERQSYLCPEVAPEFKDIKPCTL